MTAQHDQQRQDYLELLYRNDGRENQSHPMHGLYTGLYQQRQRQLVEAERQQLCGGK